MLLWRYVFTAVYFTPGFDIDLENSLMINLYLL